MAAHLGRRLRKGATTTAVAAAAVAALSASQAPGATPLAGDQPTADATPPTSSGTTATGDSPYYTDLPPLNSPNPPSGSADEPVVTGPAEAGIPATVLAAYKQAEQHLKGAKPGCNLPWQLLAGIGKVESGQARGGRVDANGTTVSPILGPVLNGVGFANISDTDGGAYDGDSRYDRAVGPMQFIPSTWADWGQDANGDGRKDPNNIYDAAQAAGMYLCANNRDLAVKADLDRAILSYNQSHEYLRTVLSWFEFYKRGTHQVPDGSGVLPTDRSDNGTGATPTPTPGPTGRTPVTTPTPKPTPSKPGVTPSPEQRVDRLEEYGSSTLTTTAGGQFADRPSVVARNDWGVAVSGAVIKFEIIGDTDARFPAGLTHVQVTTDANGRATAPVIRAGERTGQFTVRATVSTRDLPGVLWTGTVTPRQADTLTRTGDGAEPTAAPEGEFAQQVGVRATHQGAVASGVAVTATMVTEGPDGPQENTKGPYFKDAQGNPVRTLTGLRTDADGVLVLPKMYADGQTGTFLLRLTAEGGAVLTVQLKVG